MSQMASEKLYCLAFMTAISFGFLYCCIDLIVSSWTRRTLWSRIWQENPFKFKSTSYRADTASRIAILPPELREMIYYHIFNDTTDNISSLFRHANAGPKEIAMVSDSGMLPYLNTPIYHRFSDTMRFLVAPHPVLLNDIHEHLGNTYFVCEGYQMNFGLDPWCRALDTFRLIRRVRIRRPTDLARRVADFIRKLPSLEEVEVVVDRCDASGIQYSCESSAKPFQKLREYCEDAEDLTEAPFTHKSIRVVRLTTSDLHTYRDTPQHLMTGIREHKITMHQLRDNCVTTIRSSPNSSIRVELHDSLHLALNEMTQWQRLQPSFTCCVQHHTS